MCAKASKGQGRATPAAAKSAARVAAPPVHELLALTIDGHEMQVTHGTTILVAAKQAGIRIPTLCNDPRLVPFGGCRVCIVEVEGARGPVVSCATQVTDGMVVRTNTDDIRRLRKTVIELLLSDHPNACMTCDATGACDLQDLAYEYDASWERWAIQAQEAAPAGEGADGEPIPAQPALPAFVPPLGDRHVDDDNKFIQREYEKCILCGRCVRICDEVEQAYVYDFVNRSHTTRVDTPYSRSLVDTPCELCGQCVSSCPTGALLPRQSLGKGRAWQVERTETVCSYCGCGCVIELIHRDGQIVGVRGVPDKGPGWGNLCIKGRFAWQYVNSPDRLTTPLVKRDGKFEEATWDEALALIGERLAATKREHGPDAIAGLASAKCTNEENYAFQAFMRAVIGTNNVDHCARL